jgi:hypothetical protein
MRLTDFEKTGEWEFSPRGGRHQMDADFQLHICNISKGGGASAPAMDPQVTASLASNIDAQSKMAAEGWGNYNNNMAPAINNAIGAQTNRNNTYADQANEAAAAAKTTAGEQLQTYKDTALPALAAIKADADTYNQAGYQESMASEALGDVNQQFAQQQANNDLRMQAYGINPSSGASQMSGNANAIQQAMAGAAASTQARNAAAALGLQKQQNVFNLGSQSFTNANTAVNTAQNLGTSAINATQGNVNNAFGASTAANQALAAATGGYSAATNAANSAYGNQVSAYNASQQANATSSAGLGNMFGTLGAAYIKYAL